MGLAKNYSQQRDDYCSFYVLLTMIKMTKTEKGFYKMFLGAPAALFKQRLTMPPGPCPPPLVSCKCSYIIIFNFIIFNGATLRIKDKGLHKFTVSPFRPIIILEIVIVLHWDLALKKKISENITTREATTISEGKIVV